MKKLTSSAGPGTYGQKVLNLSGKKPRKPADYQAYQRLYYEKHQETLDAEWEVYKVEHPEKADSKMRMAWRNERIRELLSKETPEVRKEVDDLCNSYDVNSEDDEEEYLSQEKLLKIQRFVTHHFLVSQ